MARVVSLDLAIIKAFRCFREEVVIEFTAGGFVFLAGKNEVEPALGSNGAGKSSLWDAVVWCLYGTSVRGERASDLASWGTRERPQVTCCYTVDDEQYAIQRTGSPDMLLINDASVPQSAVDSLLGLSRIRFVQSVIYGQAAKLFMDLSVPDRGALMDEMMDLGVWLRRSEFAGTKSNDALQAISDMGTRYAVGSNRLESGIARFDELQALERQWQATNQSALSSARRDYAAADGALRQAEQDARRIEQERVALPGEQVLTDELRELQELATNIRVNQAHAQASLASCRHEHGFLTTNQVCPTCRQSIDRVFAVQRVQELTVESAEVQTKIDLLREDHVEVEVLIGDKQLALDYLRTQRIEAGNKLAGARGEVRAKQQLLVQARQHLDAVVKSAADNPFASRITALQQELEILAATVEELSSAINGLKLEQTKFEYWKRGFRQVRLFLLRRVLTVMELETAAAAASLGVGQWQIKFTVEADTRSPGIHINAVNPQEQGKYTSYSPGEAQRVKLSVSMGLGALIQSMAGVKHTMEVYDEPTQHLSVEGVDDLLECLEARADSTNKTIWLTDHRSLDYPFDEVWLATKQSNGSTVTKITAV